MATAPEFWSWHKVEAGVYELKTDNGYTVTVSRYSDPECNFSNGYYWAAWLSKPSDAAFGGYGNYSPTLAEQKAEALDLLRTEMARDAEIYG